jgi:hypothetical protein
MNILPDYFFSPWLSFELFLAQIGGSYLIGRTGAALLPPDSASTVIVAGALWMIFVMWIGARLTRPAPAQGARTGNGVDHVLGHRPAPHDARKPGGPQ